ncbi:Uncharacterised protein [Acinetobacter baumannii]|nr:Uncharacterised protein [Acinetobacter baumannii]
MKKANQSTVSCRVSTRPMRSERIPAIQPPAAEASRVMVWMKPASPVPIPHRAIRVGITKLSIWVSMPSRP